MSIYIQFVTDDVKGEVKQKGFEDHVELESVTFAMEKPGEGLTGSARRRGDVKFNDITCTKFFDSSSGSFCTNIAGGKVFGTVKIKFTASFEENVSKGSGASTQKVYLELELKAVQVTNYSLSGDGEETPKEEISMNFEEIKSIYYKRDKSGKEAGQELWGYIIDEGILT
jgi:type VI secretion system Hcp family effector